MSWTIWQRRTKCQNCGARIPVPDEGLNMTCQYCGSTAPVPDVEQRKAKQQKEQQALEQQRRQQKRKFSATQGYFIQEVDRRKTGAPGAGLIRKLIWAVVLVVAIGLPLRFTGVLDQITEPLWGETGKQRFHTAADRIRVNKFQQTSRAKVEQFFYTVKKHYLPMTRGHCYAVVMGSGKPLKKVVLTDPGGATKLTHSTLRLHDTVVHCPSKDGAYTLTLTLDHPGRYIWALFRAPRPASQRELQQLVGRQLTPQRKKRRRKKRRRGKKRRRRTGATAPRQAPQAADPAPNEPRPPDEPDPVDNELRKAFKGSEIGESDL